MLLRAGRRPGLTIAGKRPLTARLLRRRKPLRRVRLDGGVLLWFGGFEAYKLRDQDISALEVRYGSIDGFTDGTLESALRELSISPLVLMPPDLDLISDLCRGAA